MIGITEGLDIINRTLEKGIIPYMRLKNGMGGKDKYLSIDIGQVAISEEELEKLKKMGAWEIIERGRETQEFLNEVNK